MSEAIESHVDLNSLPKEERLNRRRHSAAHVLAEAMVERISPIGREMRRYLSDPASIDRILKDGAERARAIARPILEQTKDVVGYIR